VLPPHSGARPPHPDAASAHFIASRRPRRPPSFCRRVRHASFCRRVRWSGDWRRDSLNRSRGSRDVTPVDRVAASESSSEAIPISIFCRCCRCYLPGPDPPRNVKSPRTATKLRTPVIQSEGSTIPRRIRPSAGTRIATMVAKAAREIGMVRSNVPIPRTARGLTEMM
jgi:hypothetical protein